jgi:hypothetical protein
MAGFKIFLSVPQIFFGMTYNFPVNENKAALNKFSACFCQPVQITGGVNFTIDKLKVACR